MSDNPWDSLEKEEDYQYKKKQKAKKGLDSSEDIFSLSSFFKNRFNTEESGSFLLFKCKSNLQIFFCVIFFLLFLWIVSGFYTIRQEESGIVMRFGKYVRDVNSGLHYHIPFPIEEVIKGATTRVRVIAIGSKDSESRVEGELGEGWALTGDENIVSLELNVQWKIDNLKKFVFNVRDKERTIYDATQSAMREVISKRKLADILTSGRSEIEEETKQLLQNMLNDYDIGVNILVVQMLKIDPPSQVVDSFRDVQMARVDKESEINKAYKYRNDILPKVKGEAGKIIEDANGYAIAVVNRAKGDASRFNQIYNEYKNAPFVTRKRMYLDAMQDVIEKNNIVIVDENVKNVFLSGKEMFESTKTQVISDEDN